MSEKKSIQLSEEKLKELTDSMVDGRVKEALAEYKDTVKEEVKKELEKELEQKHKSGYGGDGELKDSEVKELSVKFFNSMAKGEGEKIVEVQKTFNEITKVADEELNIGTDSQGGYYVPSPIQARIITKVEQYGLARRYGMVVPMTSDTLDVPRVDTEAEFASIAEKGAYGALNYEFGNTTLNATKYGGIVKPSKEFIADANIAVIDMLFTLFARAQARTEDNIFLNGILGDANVTELVMGTGDTSFFDMTLDDALDMEDQLDDGAEEGARYVFHKDLINHLRKIKVNTSSDNRYVFGSPAGESARTLWDYPYHKNGKMPATADDGVSTSFGIFGNLENYMLGDRQQMTMQILNELYAANGQVGVLVDTRLAVGGSIPSQLVKITTAAS